MPPRRPIDPNARRDQVNVSLGDLTKAVWDFHDVHTRPLEADAPVQQTIRLLIRMALSSTPDQMALAEARARAFIAVRRETYARLSQALTTIAAEIDASQAIEQQMAQGGPQPDMAIEAFVPHGRFG